MPTNQQRREAAKRKLQRQLVRRQQRDRVRRQRLLIVGVIAAVLVVAGGVWFFTTRSDTPDTAANNNSTSTDTAATSAPALPCTYTAGGTAAKKVDLPANTSPANTGTVDVTLTINGEAAAASLDRQAAPCTVNSFLSLASQGFYDGTSCHRLTKSDRLNVLQCGDPTAKGNGGPGYTFANENLGDTSYPVGTIAMANSGPDTNGSQFFVVYGKTVLTGSYTVFGKMSEAGMKMVQAIAVKGVTNDAQDGKPIAPAAIDKVTVPTDALAGSGNYATSSAAETAGLPTVGSAPASSAAESPTAGSSAAPSSVN